MKNFKKIASAIAALSLAACVAVPMSATVFTASAVDPVTSVIKKDDANNTITINDNVGDHTYKAYQIFAGNLEKTVTDATTTYGALTEITWGSGITVSPEGVEDNIYAALAKIQLADNSKPFTKDDTNALDSPKAVADVLSEKANGQVDSEIAKTFAQAIAPYLNDTNAKAFLEQTTGDDGAITGYKTKDGLNPGYYLVKQEGLTSGSSNDAYTRFILKVAGEITASPKKSSPSVDKQVSDNDEGDASESPSDKRPESAGADDKFYETADHAIGESFQFKLTAEMTGSKELDEYKRYTLKFSDTMAAGVTYEGIASVQIIYKDSTAASDVAAKDTNTNKDGYDIDFPAALAKEGTLENTHKGDGTTAWTLTIPDLKKYLTAGKNLSDVKSVEVVYNAHLNDEAIVVNSDVDSSAGSYGADEMKVNINKVDLEYSNNPNKTNWGGEGNPDTETGKTPEDTVGVFTYKVTSTKVDGASKQGDSYNKTLPGAVFSLYAKDPKTEKTDNDAIKLVEVKKGANTLGYRLATVEEAKVEKGSGEVYVTEITTPATGEFVFYGLDAGTYYIDEVTAPSGYNKLEKAVKVEIVAKHAEVDDASATLNLSTNSKYDDTAISSAIEGNIENNKGATLPSTGGIGTTLFYLGGGALVAVAGVMLITKKRMTKE